MESNQEDRFSDGLLLACDGTRIVALRPSPEHIQLLRGYSAPITDCAFQEAVDFVGFVCKKDKVILLPSNAGAFDTLKKIIGDLEFTVATSASPQIKSVLLRHLQDAGVLKEWSLVTVKAVVPRYLQRLYDRFACDVSD